MSKRGGVRQSSSSSLPLLFAGTAGFGGSGGCLSAFFSAFLSAFGSSTLGGVGGGVHPSGARSIRTRACGLFNGLQRSFFHSVRPENTAFSGLKYGIRFGVVIGINFFFSQVPAEDNTAQRPTFNDGPWQSAPGAEKRACTGAVLEC